jgi:DUF971 family protein
MIDKPAHLDLEKDRGLTVRWADGTSSFYAVEHLRRMSPSAETRQLRAELEQNPLAVLPPQAVSSNGPLTVVDAEFVGHYAIRITFSDGHDTGIYSWSYLRRIDPARPAAPGQPAEEDA